MCKFQENLNFWRDISSDRRIKRKMEKRMDRETDTRTDRPEFIGTFWTWLGFQ